MTISITPRGGAFTARGGWDAKTVFFQDDFCVFNGIEYQSLTPYNVGNQPDVSAFAWQAQPPGTPFAFVTAQPLTELPFGDGTRFFPAGSQSLMPDQYGNIQFNENPMQPPQLWAGNNANFFTQSYPLFGGAFYKPSERFFFRDLLLTEYQNPANLQLGRVDGLPDIAGWPNLALTQLSAPITVAGGPINSLPIAPLTANRYGSGLKAGDIVKLTQGWPGTVLQTQAWTVAAPGASVGDTSIPVSPLTPNIDYAAGTNVNSSNGIPAWSNASGILQGQVLGKIVFWGGIATDGNPGGLGSVNQQDSIQVYGQSGEHFVKTGVQYATGAHFFVDTRRSGVAGSLQTAFGVSSQGFSVFTDNAVITRGMLDSSSATLSYLNPGDVISSGKFYSVNRATFSNPVDNSTGPSAVMVGAVGPSNQAGINFGTDATQKRLYNDVTGPNQPGMRFSSALIVDGTIKTPQQIQFTAAALFQTTVGAAGAASALPATPSKYLKITDSGGTTFVIPCYLAV